VAEKLKLNQVTLREQRQLLALYGEFLPTLELRKLQLLNEIRRLAKTQSEKEAALQALIEGAASWSPMLAKVLPRLTPLVALEKVEVRSGNVAGTRVPIFERVRFKAVSYSLLGTPPFFDAAIAHFQRAISAREELRVVREQQAILQRELNKTTQRINLYREVLIPEATENVRRIKVYLGDQYTAAVCRAKIAKRKLVAKATARAAEAGGDGWA
jgi:V/A-type H+-transporting ATPase subunit D